MANELRIRSNFAAGAIDAALSAGDTTLSSPGLADLVAVTSAGHAAITLFDRDADGRITKSEIVYITAHTASATTATMTRGEEGTTAQSWSIGDNWVHGPTTRDMVKSERKTRTAGDLTLNSTTWADVDTALDITLPARVGDELEASAIGTVGATAVTTIFDVATIVSAAVVNYFTGGGGATLVEGSWLIPASALSFPIAGVPAPYTVVSGDLSGGTVTCRLRYRTNTATNRTLRATSGHPLRFVLKNLGPASTST
jgi:hypothetical protein